MKYHVGQEVTFRHARTGMEVSGRIKEVVYDSKTGEVLHHRIFVHEHPCLEHHSCIYGGIKEEYILSSN